MRSTLAPLALLAAALSTGCRTDPVEQQLIDSLGPEIGTPSATHRPGQPCLACHTAYGGASPELAIGGTLFALSEKGDSLVPVPNVRVLVEDSSGTNGEPGVIRTACSNSAGNFYVLAADWTEPSPVFPLSPRVNVTPTTTGVGMVSLVGRDGSCATCHMMASQVNPSDLIDPVRGSGHTSAGVIIASPTGIDPACQEAQ